MLVRCLLGYTFFVRFLCATFDVVVAYGFNGGTGYFVGSHVFKLHFRFLVVEASL